MHTHSHGTSKGMYNGVPKKTNQLHLFSLGLYPWHLSPDWKQDLAKIEKNVNQQLQRQLPATQKNV